MRWAAILVIHLDHNRRTKNSERSDQIIRPGVLWRGTISIFLRRRREMLHFECFAAVGVEQFGRTGSSFSDNTANSGQCELEFFRFRGRWDEKSVLRWTRLCWLDSQNNFCDWSAWRMGLQIQL